MRDLDSGMTGDRVPLTDIQLVEIVASRTFRMEKASNKTIMTADATGQGYAC